MADDDTDLDEALPPDLLHALRAPIEVDSERREEQIATALSQFAGDVSSLDRLRSRRARWLPAAAAVVLAIVLGAGVVSRLGDSVRETADRAGRTNAPDRSTGDVLDKGLATEAEGMASLPEAPPPMEGTGSAASVDASQSRPGEMGVEGSPAYAASCPGGGWWQTIRALLGRCR